MLKSVLWILALIAAAYLAVCGFMYTQQRNLIYYPQPTRTDAARTDFALVRGDVTLRGWVVNPGQRDVLLYFGGNAEAIERNRDDFRSWFPHHTVYLLAYRGYGASDGTPVEADLFADALALHDDVVAHHPGANVDVIGRSLGSGVAAQLAARRPVRRLVLVTPYDSMAEVGQSLYPWLPVRWLARDRFDSVAWLADHKGPVLVVRAGVDAVVPFASTQRLIDALPRHPDVLELPGADHNSVGADPRYRDSLKAFLGPVDAIGADRVAPQ
ncbi:alpha/beta hydrolase [Lysobacter fragariae]